MAEDRGKYHTTDGSVQLLTHPEFLSKNFRSSDLMSTLRPIINPSLERFVCPDLLMDSYICPVRVLKEKKLLFISMIPTSSEISPNTIYAWIKELISSAYVIQNNRSAVAVPVPSNVKAHKVRGLAASSIRVMTVHDPYRPSVLSDETGADGKNLAKKDTVALKKKELQLYKLFQDSGCSHSSSLSSSPVVAGSVKFGVGLATSSTNPRLSGL